MKGIACYMALVSVTMALCGLRRTYKQTDNTRAVASLIERFTLSEGDPFSDVRGMKCLSACTQLSCSAVNLYKNGTCEHIVSATFKVVVDATSQLYTDKPYACPGGFGHFFSGGYPRTDGGYTPSCYRYLTDKLTWQAAWDRCRLLGGDLLSVESEQEKSHMIQVGSLLGLEGSIWIWTSGSDVSEENTWMWTGTGSIIQYSDWKIGEPNNAGGEDCLCMEIKADNSWNDAKCGTSYNAFCEVSAVFLNV